MVLYEGLSIMGKKIASNFIIASIIFFILACIEGCIFPTKHMLKSLYSTIMQIPSAQLKFFLSDFFPRIHSHISLVGWVSSALMGVIYFIVPQIRGEENYNKSLCYANLWMHIGGVVILCVGWHVIGSVGISAGYKHGTADFTRVVASYKPIIWTGSLAILISAGLFSYNIFSCLCFKDKDTTK